MTKEKRAAIHYVNNKEFSEAVVQYCKEIAVAKENGQQIPVVPDYVAQCFLKIAEGLSHKSNFIRYTYREEMVMDAVENCLRAVENYNIEAATRTGTPNAFAYFTQISLKRKSNRTSNLSTSRNLVLKIMLFQAVWIQHLSRLCKASSTP